MSTISPASLSQTNSASVLLVDSKLKNAAELAGRVLLTLMFLLSGLSKISGYAGTAAFMASVGVSGALLPLVIMTEVAGAAAIIVGWNTRIAAFLLAGFSLVTAVVFHSNLADQIQMIMFMKNVSIAGALLILTVNGAGRYSLDARKSR